MSYCKGVGWRTDQFFNRIPPIKLVLPPSSLEDEQMFPRADEVFALTSGESQADVREAEADSHSAGAHQLLTELYSVPVNGKKSFTSRFMQ